MEFTTELSLSSRKFETTSSSDNVNPKKRKMMMLTSTSSNSMSSSSLKCSNGGDHDDLHQVMMNNRRPLPLDWEQCLDLHSGTMYYMNRKTSRKSWNMPPNHNNEDDRDLDLGLNISSSNNNNNHSSVGVNSSTDNNKKLLVGTTDSSCNMVALACSNCHLLVIVSKSAPSCPNCKYIHSSLDPTLAHPSAPRVSSGGYDEGLRRHPPKSISNMTLSLLN
ncbi:hypothetical protein LINPERHAP2_LOCUS29870 [Linum perenne]